MRIHIGRCIPGRPRRSRHRGCITCVDMLAFDDLGAGAPLLLLHGTTSSRAVWDPILPALIAHRRVIRADLPCHGASAPTSFTPPDWAREVVQFLDALGLDQVPIAGHSAGAWTALEVAKLGRASAVLSLTPAGLWRQRSPRTTNAGLMLNWQLSRHAFGLSGGRCGSVPYAPSHCDRSALAAVRCRRKSPSRPPAPPARPTASGSTSRRPAAAASPAEMRSRRPCRSASCGVTSTTSQRPRPRATGTSFRRTRPSRRGTDAVTWSCGTSLSASLLRR